MYDIIVNHLIILIWAGFEFEKKFERIIVFILSASILLSINNFHFIAEDNETYGDLDNNGMFNVIDLVLLKRTLLGTEPFPISLYSADMNMDYKIDLIDLIRMKKYFAGGVNHSNDVYVPLTWILLNGDDGTPIVTGVSFLMYFSCNVQSDCLPGRYFIKASSYISTDKNPNPELATPKINIVSILINDTELELMDSSVIVAPNKIWDYKATNTSVGIQERSSFYSLSTVMLDDTIYPYNDLENTFIF